MFWNKLFNRKSQISINEILCAVKKTVNYNQKKFNYYQIEKLNRLYNDDGSPIVKKIQIDKNSFIEIPLITLINNQILSIHEFTFTFNVKAENLKKTGVKRQLKYMKESGITLNYHQNIYDKDKITIQLSLKK